MLFRFAPASVDSRRAHRATAGLGIEAVPRSVRVPGVAATDLRSRLVVYQ